jgi:hypothetical protein
MRAVVVILVVVLAFGLYYAHHGPSGKMSAAGLETVLYKTSLAWTPTSPIRMSCQGDPQRKWDYLCTDSAGQVWGFDVNGTRVTLSALVADRYGNLVSGG